MESNKEKTIFYFKKDPGYETLQNITGGYFTTLKLIDGKTLFLRENGEYSCKLNQEASNMFGIKMYGNIAIVG
tara:strand:- start:278 stop:496 length:219 start_codon:yes stop_codon:yes gene_type:complete